MSRLAAFLLALSVLFPAAGEERAPSEQELAAISYFAPICPLFYRMMCPDGQLVEFQQKGERRFIAPPGWSASRKGNAVRVTDPLHHGFTFVDGRLSTYESNGKSYSISYPFEPMYGGAPASLWGCDPSELDARQLESMVDIWRKGNRFRMWFRSPNAAAGLLAEIAVAAAAVFLFAGRFASIAGLIAMLASLAGLALTSSRGGILAFGLGLAILLVLAFLRRAVRPVGKRVWVLLIGMVLAAVFAVATQGISRFTSDLGKDISGKGKSYDRTELFAVGPRMMADAPSGWGVSNAGGAYSNWYQSMGGNKWQTTLVSDQLTHLVGYGWFGRWLWIFGWFLVLVVLFRAALRGFAAAAPAVWAVLFAASAFNVMLGRWELWILPVAFAGWFAVGRFWRERRFLAMPALIALGLSVLAWGGLFAVAAYSAEAVPSIRLDGNCVYVNGRNPRIWIVDDGQTLGGIYTQNVIRRHYLEHPKAPPIAYSRSLRNLPPSVDRLVLAGGQCQAYLDLFGSGRAPLAKELVFVSPPFGSKGIPEELHRTCAFRMLLGEFAARYVDVYGEGSHPEWVVIVKGAELYIPRWMDYALSGMDVRK